MKLAIYGSKRQQDYLPLIEQFMLELDRRSDSVVMHTKLYNYLLHLIPRALKCVTRVCDTCDFTADYAVSLGGDGSFLRTAAWVADKEIPVLGVNTGHLGFLASMDIDRLPQLPEIIERGAFSIVPLSLLEVVSPRIAGWPFALNEVTVSKSESSSIVGVNVWVDGVDLAHYRADGLIVATPTGSTAYNLSVGGPIVVPHAPVFVLSPIAAHSLSMRPVVLADDVTLDMQCEGRSPQYRISLDGRSSSHPMDEPVKLRRAPFVVRAMQLEGHNFPATLREKLAWG